MHTDSFIFTWYFHTIHFFICDSNILIHLFPFVILSHDSFLMWFTYRFISFHVYFFHTIHFLLRCDSVKRFTSLHMILICDSVQMDFFLTWLLHRIPSSYTILYSVFFSRYSFIWFISLPKWFLTWFIHFHLVLCNMIRFSPCDSSKQISFFSDMIL